MLKTKQGHIIHEIWTSEDGQLFVIAENPLKEDHQIEWGAYYNLEKGYWGYGHYDYKDISTARLDLLNEYSKHFKLNLIYASLNTPLSRLINDNENLEIMDNAIDKIKELMLDIADENEDFVCTQCLDTLSKLFDILDILEYPEDKGFKNKIYNKCNL